MTLSVAIMGHPSRVLSWTALREALGRAGTWPLLSIEVDGLGCWPTARAAWEMGDWASHHMVLQDDTILFRRFLEGVRGAIKARPKSPITFFLKSAKTKAADTAWTRLAYTTSGQCLVMPAGLSKWFLEWEAENCNPDCDIYDGRVALFCEEFDIPVYATIPSLVDHDVLNNPSLLGHPNCSPKRYYVATRFSRYLDASTVNWNLGITSPVRISASPVSNQLKKKTAKARAGLPDTLARIQRIVEGRGYGRA